MFLNINLNKIFFFFMLHQSINMSQGLIYLLKSGVQETTIDFKGKMNILLVKVVLPRESQFTFKQKFPFIV